MRPWLSWKSQVVSAARCGPVLSDGDANMRVQAFVNRSARVLNIAANTVAELIKSQYREGATAGHLFHGLAIRGLGQINAAFSTVATP